jgi:hypothetical protein
MPAKQLIQKGWSLKNEVNIEDNHLTVKRKTQKEDLDYQIKFEELGFELFKKVDRSTNFGFYFFGISNILMIYGLFKAITGHEPLSSILICISCIVLFGFLCVSAYKERNKEIIYLSGGSKALELLATDPDRETVSAFIDDIHNAMRAYYRRIYTDFEEDTPYEEKLAVLKWLREIKSITDEEFNELKATYKTDNIIGFKRDDNDQY